MIDVERMVRIMRSVGATDAQIIKYLELQNKVDLEAEAEKREANRIRQRNHRVRNASHCDTRDSCDTRDDTLTKEVSKKEATNEERKESKKVRIARLHAIPEDWRPNDHHAALCSTLHVPLGEVEAVFRDSCAATGKLYANHDFAFNNYIRNFNKFNGGNGHERTRTAHSSSRDDNIVAGFGRVFGGGNGPMAGPTTEEIPSGTFNFDAKPTRRS
jgi:hypothetical protein